MQYLLSTAVQMVKRSCSVFFLSVRFRLSFSPAAGRSDPGKVYNILGIRFSLCLCVRNFSSRNSYCRVECKSDLRSEAEHRARSDAWSRRTSETQRFLLRLLPSSERAAERSVLDCRVFVTPELSHIDQKFQLKKRRHIAHHSPAHSSGPQSPRAQMWNDPTPAKRVHTRIASHLPS